MDCSPATTRRWRQRGFSLVELLVVIAIIGVLVALLLPAIQAAREAARSSSCRNNLRQIAVAIQNYSDAHRQLPTARLDFGTNGAGNSTFIAILPFLEEGTSADLFDETKSYRATDANLKVANTPMPTYMCPSMALPRQVPEPDTACGEYGAPGSYAVCTGSGLTFAANHDALFTDMPPHDGTIVHPKYGYVTFAKIADGTSRTFMVGEKDFGLENYMFDSCKPMVVRWGDTRWAVAYPGVTWGSTLALPNSTRLVNKQYGLFWEEYDSFRSDHVGGLYFAFADGSVRFVADDIEHRVYNALATRAGEENIDY
ncbi:MAG: DUF1559 domain-containing protein [Planctomycetota bacterium]|nr:MAG: DUF1559 domain-containing protein [Planctomycetota bacterium]